MELIAELAGESSTANLRLASKEWYTAAGYGLRVYFGHLTLEDARMAKICAMFPHLVTLNLQGCPLLTDSALNSIARLHRLTHLSLACPQGIPSGIQGGHTEVCWLGALPQLRDLNLSGCESLVDDALIGLGQLSLLSRLNLAGCTSLTDREGFCLRERVWLL